MLLLLESLEFPSLRDWLSDLDTGIEKAFLGSRQFCDAIAALTGVDDVVQNLVGVLVEFWCVGCSSGAIADVDALLGLLLLLLLSEFCVRSDADDFLGTWLCLL